MSKLFSGLYEIVEHQCKYDHIQALLREYKEHSKKHFSEIRYSGTKPEIVKNLRRVVSAGLIPKQRVYDLIQSSEENGHQHIFYFRPSDQLLETIRKGDEIAQALFEDQWGEDFFPRFDRFEDSLSWSDFRIGLPGKPKDWVAKVYGHQKVNRVTKREIKDETATSFTEVVNYVRKDFSYILMARWNDPDLLEVRIDQEGLLKSGMLETRLGDILSLLGKAIPADQIEPAALTNVVHNLLEKRTENKSQYIIGTARLHDASRGIIDFYPDHDDEEIDTDPGRAEALNNLLAAKARARKMGIKWKQIEGSEHILPGDLPTVITGEHLNQLVISSKTTAAAIDYVTNQLRQNS
ncbi:hypothetical protein ACYFX5_12820 [Bremerella sp. T1]|uniref:hypothetical protein n=1 Tax=Bremerella sp. TYQ1 TaxID=3119568 RepID=UPI001CCD5F99|nr:hypothetical protein [Bremerella volcania]UBM33943.1 hypothetical protein LA756_14765 [Bremerella volcania]